MKVQIPITPISDLLFDKDIKKHEKEEEKSTGSEELDKVNKTLDHMYKDIEYKNNNYK